MTGGDLPSSLDLSSDQWFNFTADNVPGTSAAFTTAQLQNFMQVDIDNSGSPVTVDLTGLTGQGAITGVQLADAIQDQLNTKFGDERYFDLTTTSNQTFRVTDGTTTANIDLSNLTTAGATNKSQVTVAEMVTGIQTDINAASNGFITVLSLIHI